MGFVTNPPGTNPGGKPLPPPILPPPIPPIKFVLVNEPPPLGLEFVNPLFPPLVKPPPPRILVLLFVLVILPLFVRILVFKIQVPFVLV